MRSRLFVDPGRDQTAGIRRLVWAVLLKRTFGVESKTGLKLDDCACAPELDDAWTDLRGTSDEDLPVFRDNDRLNG
jgi:hypothetical protein